MRYKIDNEGYITDVYFNCHTGTCNEYTGEIPSGYETLLEWSEKANIQAYKLVDGNLVYDPNRDEELRFIHEQEAEENTTATRGWVKNKLNSANSVVVDELSKSITGTSLVKIDDSGEYEIPIITLSSSTDGRVDVVSSNKNLLGIDALTKTVNGVTFTVNADGSITLNGASTADIELDLKGTSTSIEMLFLIKGGLDYTISGLVNNVSLNLYNYDGTDRTLIGSYNNKTINLSSSEIVTYSTLYIASGKTFSNITICPQVEVGKIGTPFVQHDESRTTINIKNTTGASINDLQSYEPITVLMTNKEANIDIDYFVHKYLENKFADIEKTNDEIRLSVESMNDEFQPISDVYGLGELKLPDSAGEDLIEFVVEGKSEQATRSGKNLWKLPQTSTLNGITCTNNGDGTITLNGTATANADFYVEDNSSNYTNGEKYYISSNINKSDVTIIIANYNGNTYSNTLINSNGTMPFTMNTTNNKVRLIVRALSGKTFNNTKLQIQMEKSSTATEWEPYGASPSPDYPSEIKSISGIENLLKASREFTGMQGYSEITNETYKDCVIRKLDMSDWTSGYQEFAQWPNIREKQGIDFKAGGVYTFSFWSKATSSSSYGNLLCYFYGLSGYAKVRIIASSTGYTRDSYDDGNWNWRSTTFDGKWHRHWVTWEIDPSADETTISIDKHLLIRQYFGWNVEICGCMFEEGYVSHDYVPDGANYLIVETTNENSEEAISLIDLKGNKLCSNKDLTTRDLLTVKNGLASIDKKLKEVILDGSTEVIIYKTASNKNGFYVKTNGVFYGGTSSTKRGTLFSNKFLEKTRNEIFLEKNGIAYNSNSAYLIVYYDECNTMTADDFKTWLSENPITVQYELATPETIDLGEVSIQTVQSDCTLELEEEVKTNMYAKYVRYTPYNEAYITRSEAKAEIKLTKDEIELKVSKDDVVSTINQSAEQITLKGNRVVIESDKFDLNADGTIEATGGTVGGFSMNEEEFYTNIYAPYDYTETDFNKIIDYVRNGGSLTEAEVIKYDVNSDGVVDLLDALWISNYVNHNITTTNPAKLRINSKNVFDIFSLKDGNGKDIFRLGLFGVEASNITNDSGRETVSTTANAIASHTIYFGTAFTSAPNVTVTPVTAYPNNNWKISVGNITTEKFDIFVYDTANSNITFCWNAMN